jgi:hypothetical protein
LGCGSKAAGSQPREKTPGCCGLNCLEQPQKTALKKNARWLKRAVATRKKTPKKRPVAAVAGGGICLKKVVKKSPFKVVIIIRKVKLR